VSEAGFVQALKLEHLKSGTMCAVRIGAQQMVLCRTRHGVFALDDLCTHARTRMSEGELRGDKLICPLHGAVFDVRTGAILAGPAILPLRTYPVRVVGNEIEVRIATNPAAP